MTRKCITPLPARNIRVQWPDRILQNLEVSTLDSTAITDNISLIEISQIRRNVEQWRVTFRMPDKQVVDIHIWDKPCWEGISHEISTAVSARISESDFDEPTHNKVRLMSYLALKEYGKTDWVVVWTTEAIYRL